MASTKNVEMAMTARIHQEEENEVAGSISVSESALIYSQSLSQVPKQTIEGKYKVFT